MVVEEDVAVEGGFRVLVGEEVVGFEDVGDAAIEAFNHAICLRAVGLSEAVFNAEGLAELVERMLAGGLALGAGQQFGG